MPYSESLPVKIPGNAIEAVQASVLPSPLPRNAVLELIISLDPTELKARDLASYLSLIDHVYGRLDPRGLLSYAHRKEGHIEISDVRTGSVDMVIAELIEHSPPLVVVFLALYYLPEALRNLATAFHEYEEGRLTRLRRSQLRDRVRQDAQLAQISDRHKEQIVVLLDTIYVLEQGDLAGAQRLARARVRSVRIRVIPASPDSADENPENQ
jgi:hypothetical protein